MTAALAFSAGLALGGWLTWRDMIASIRRLQQRERQLRAAIRERGTE